MTARHCHVEVRLYGDSVCLCVSCVYVFALRTVTAGPEAAGGHAEPSDRSVGNIPTEHSGSIGPYDSILGPDE